MSKILNGGPVHGVVGQLEKCMFSDECDFCAAPSMGTYAKMSRVPMENSEAEWYICGRCATMRDWLPNTEPSLAAETKSPCPFCGNPADDVFQRDGLWQVCCSECTGEGPSFETKSEAIISWNRRVSLPNTPISRQPPFPQSPSQPSIDGGGQ